jgi:hypothetical protein
MSSEYTNSANPVFCLEKQIFKRPVNLAYCHTLFLLNFQFTDCMIFDTFTVYSLQNYVYIEVFFTSLTTIPVSVIRTIVKAA